MYIHVKLKGVVITTLCLAARVIFGLGFSYVLHVMRKLIVNLKKMV